jgi:hypothetical protein
MIKRRSFKAFVYFLLAAFLVFKWVPSHVHLSAQHNHGDAHHRHSVKVHAHPTPVLHEGLVGLDNSQMDESRVVNLSHDQSLQKCTSLDHPAILTAGADYPRFIQPAEIMFPEWQYFQLRSLYLHPGQPRAPPLFS